MGTDEINQGNFQRCLLQMMFYNHFEINDSPFIKVIKQDSESVT